MKNILFFGWLFLEWGIGFLRRGRSFVGMTILGVVVFGMGDWVLTQRSLLRRDDNFGGGCFGMGDGVLTQGSLLRRDDNFGWGWFGMGDLFLTQGSLLCRDDNYGWVEALLI